MYVCVYVCKIQGTHTKHTIVPYQFRPKLIIFLKWWCHMSPNCSSKCKKILIWDVPLKHFFSMFILIVYSFFILECIKYASNYFQLTLCAGVRRILLCKTMRYHYLPKSRITIYIHVVQFPSSWCTKSPNQTPSRLGIKHKIIFVMTSKVPELIKVFWECTS